MAVLLSAKEVEIDFPAKRVFSGITLGVNEGDRIGIVGNNGDGKSTLLSVLAGTIIPDAGMVTYRNNPTIGMLGQADHLDDENTVREAVIGELPEHLWASDRRTREIVETLLADISWDRKLKELSGGQRRRADLARLLIGDWDILMLDEPTNHLDMHAIAWLAAHLKTRWQKNAGALLVVTHDRWFLDEVASTMWEVHDGTIDPFEGGYSAYILQRVEREQAEQLAEQKRKNMARKELAWLSRGARARSSKPKFHLETAWELISSEPPVRNSIELKQAAMTRLGKQVLELRKVSKSFGDIDVLKEVDWLIGPGDRFGILGENGAGKSTLLNIIQGTVAASSGMVKRGKTVKMALLSQRLEELEEYRDDRVREVLGRHKTRLVVDGKSVTSAQLLERLGFQREHLQSYVKDLSGGQKRRLQLLLVLIDEPNVLILDEPGNDMDTDMLAVMEDLLDSWPGTLLVVSHDRYLIERVTDDQYALINGNIKHMPGGVDEYLGALEAAGTQKDSTAKPTRSNAHPSAAISGGEAYQAKKQLKSTERKLASLEKQTESIQETMAHTEPTDYLALGKLEQELQAVKAQISDLESLWLELSEKLES